MMIHLPSDLESSVHAAVQGGRFASVDDAMAEAVRRLLRELDLGQQPTHSSVNSDHDPVPGCMRYDAELMDEIVADAYRQRQDDTWRKFDL